MRVRVQLRVRVRGGVRVGRRVWVRVRVRVRVPEQVSIRNYINYLYDILCIFENTAEDQGSEVYCGGKRQLPTSLPPGCTVKYTEMRETDRVAVDSHMACI